MSITENLFKHSQNQGSHIAFSELDREISYQDFSMQAVKLSHLLQQQGISNKDRVAIFLPRGIDAALSIYATLLCQACYVPLDIQNPAPRLKYIIHDVQAACIIGIGARPDWCDSSLLWIDLQSINDIDAKEITAQPSQHDNEQIAAILYTSGSTGNPKGVAISHRAIQAFVQWSSDTFVLKPHDHIASLAPFHFDLSLFDLFSSIHHGTSTHFIPQRLTMSPKKMVDWLESKSITTWYTVPSILSFLTLRGGLNPERIPTLKRILFAGEVFPLPNLIKLAEALPHIQLYNLFGPTETNVCTFWQVDREVLKKITQIPIGIPACEAELSISDEGELLVQGPCLMSGYWHNGALQKNTTPYHHSGDKVSLNANKQYLYHGRMDRMIKSSGYRIEPAEIEQKINQFEGVEESVVMGEDDSITGQRLIAIISGRHVDIAALRGYLKKNIASYMQPYRFIVLDSLPHLSNGKLDYQQLNKQLQQLSNNT